ncbi:acyl-CoA dehydrogenase family protein, partial [Pseudomonas sp. K5002]|uniref:acyl-CoA dehydrogenase family protein n=1 Tax=Pseudomonas sp. K5002 TaxID=2738828 RepID=UPI0015B9DAB3
ADPALGQIPQNHFGILHVLQGAASERQKKQLFQSVLDGWRIGNGGPERGTKNTLDLKSRITAEGDGYVVSGQKFYSTGALFAHWVAVKALNDDGKVVMAFVRRGTEGLRIVDDWSGFGQRTTGSGTSRFTDAVVEAENVIDFATRFKYQTAFYQLVLLATLAGIGRAALKDVAHQVRSRKRIYSHGNAAHVSQDSQIQQVVGEVAALVYAAEASALKAAVPAQRAYVARFGGDDAVEHEANVAAEIESATAQVVVSELIQRATTELFNALGASDVRQGKALDRHWRNARTVSSHNPVIYKARIVGDWVINRTEPPFVWQIGNGPAR